MILACAVDNCAVLFENGSESVDLGFSQLNVNSAERVNGLNKAFEVDAYIMIDPNLIVLLNCINKQLWPSVCVCRIESCVGMSRDGDVCGS